MIDSATRMGFLTFLPFLLQSKAAGLSEIGLALTMVFAGGAAGKLVCGFLGARLGILPTVLLTEGATAVDILALLPLPIGAALALLPVIGVALNGTSSVLYGTVPELVPADRRESALGVFYSARSAPGHYHPFYTESGPGHQPPARHRDRIGLLPRRCRLASALALMFANPPLMSFAQNGTSPQRIKSKLRSLVLGS